MCGIVGEFRSAAGPTTAPWSQLLGLMARRGPDDEGVWTDGERCTLGFRRLSILDLSPTGHQPMVTEDGRYVIVYNGEVYNFPELKQELSRHGVRFRSTGDTEVVLYALARRWHEALDRCNGMFALAIYDRVEKRLLLARDHAGIKPLYYLLGSEGVAFASQYDQIMAHPWAKQLQVSREALGEYLNFGYISAPSALLENSYMLEPGAWLEVDAQGRCKRGRFFNFPVFQEPDLRGEEAYEAVDSVVSSAVRRHLVSDVPVGAFLSGGIDSPLVVAKMKAAGNGSVRAFTIGTQGDSLDESPDAVAYARELGVDHIVEHVSPQQALEMLDDVVASCGEPFADYSIFPTMLVSRIARRHLKVMLSGDGGDELFWGYAGRFASVLEGCEHFAQPYWSRHVHWWIKRSMRAAGDCAFLKYRSIGDWQRSKHLRITDASLQRIFPEFSQREPRLPLFDYNSSQLDRTAQWLRWNEFTGHLTMVLLKVDRASMFHSLEVRVPLLDREVIDVAARVDWRSCLDVERGIGKLPLRAALSRHVEHQTTKKRGFEVPMGAWLRGPLRSLFEDAVIGRKEIVGLGINQKELGRVFGEHLSGRKNLARSLWTLLSLALWEDRHYKNRYCQTDDDDSPARATAVSLVP